MNRATQTTENDSTAELPPAIRRHLGWQTIFEVVGSVGAPGVFVGYRFGVAVVSDGWLVGFVFLSLFIVGYLGPRAVFRHFIGATCPDCHGRVFPTGTKPIIYVCRVCQRQYPTELFENDDGMGEGSGPDTMR